MHVAIIGAGKDGCALQRALSRAGLGLTGVC